jgi:DNA end-binding protein Ku
MPSKTTRRARAGTAEKAGTNRARALWSGALSFGLVNIPVEVHSAVRENRPHFRMLHAKDHSPINFERVCAKEGKTVAWQEIVKGFEYEKGRFVVLTKEEIAAAAVEKTRRIDILDFVKPDAIDDRFFDKPYYLVPGKGGDASYALLREAIRDSRFIGVAKFILRDVQHLAAVEVIGEALVLSTLRFADELVDVTALRLPRATALKKQDLALAKTLVGHLADDWTPEKYTDDYRDNLMRLIKAKMKGKKADLVSEDQIREPKVVDLMERLRRSLDARGGKARSSPASRNGKTARGTKRTGRRSAA